MTGIAQAWCDRARTLLTMPVAERAGGADATRAAPAFDLAAFRRRFAQSLKTWIAASEAVDAQLAKLQGALQNSNDPELQLIGELGLNAVTGNFKVPLLAALRSLGSLSVEEHAAGVDAARQAIAGFRRHLSTSEEVAVVDDNPLDVPVQIVATLVPALDALDQSLR